MRFANAVSAPSTSNNLPRNPVHPLIRWLSQLWLVPRRMMLRRRVQSLIVERVAGRDFIVLPEVFNPGIFRTGRFLAEYLQKTPTLNDSCTTEQRTALDTGTGCGIHAVFAAAQGYQVEAVDISPAATRCARMNVILNDLEDHVTVHEGDLFSPVPDQKFDLVTCSLPKFRGHPNSEFELSWRSPDVIDRFARGLPGVMKPNGIALVLLTSHGDERGMLEALRAAGLSIEIAERRHFGVEIMTIYRVTHATTDRCD